MSTGVGPGRRRLAAGAFLLAGLVGVVLLAGRGGGDRLPEGTTIGGVDVGGLDPDLARSAVARRARGVVARGVVITSPDVPGLRVRVDAAALGATPRIGEALERARDDGSFVDRVRARAGIPGTREIPLTYAFDGRRVDALADRIQGRLGARPVPAGAAVAADGSVRVTAGRAGAGVDDRTLRAALATLPETIVLDRVPLPPPVTVTAARRARDRARTLLESPPAVVAGGDAVPLDPALLRRALRFAADPPALRVRLDPEVLGPVLRDAFADRERDRRDADLAVRGGRVVVVPDRPGVAIDVAATAGRIAAARGDRVRLAVRGLPAQRTAAELRALGADSEVATFTTEYPCCEPRVTNIRRAAEILDGTILPPGGRFDLNAALGERTVARGFVAAPQIADGQFEEGVGGGVSQVATTLYNAAFFAGLELVAHTPHEVYIGRYPMGREATVSWGGPELVFRNDWDAPLYMAVRATDASITVRMFSKGLGRRVETETGEPTGERRPEIVRRTDPTLDPGTEVVDQSLGGPGFTVAYTRRVYRGSELRREETFRWTYRPVDAYVRVGPEAPEATTTAPPAETEPPATTTARDAPPPATTTRSAPPAGIPQTPPG